MSIGNAKKFIARGMEDMSLRNTLNRASTIAVVNQTLEAEGLAFSVFEFEDAYNNALTLCQFEEQADQLSEFRMWWELLNHFLGGNSAAASCVSSSSCASGSPCSSGSCAGCG